MPREAYLSERAVVRWMRRRHPSPASRHYDDLADRLAAELGDAGRALALEFDEMAGELALELHDQLLFYVGTLLVQHGQAEMWRTIYSGTSEDEAEGGEQQFLADKTAAVRRNEF